MVYSHRAQGLALRCSGHERQRSALLLAPVALCVDCGASRREMGRRDAVGCGRGMQLVRSSPPGALPTTTVPTRWIAWTAGERSAGERNEIDFGPAVGGASLPCRLPRAGASACARRLRWRSGEDGRSGAFERSCPARGAHLHLPGPGGVPRCEGLRPVRGGDGHHDRLVHHQRGGDRAGGGRSGADRDRRGEWCRHAGGEGGERHRRGLARRGSEPGAAGIGGWRRPDRHPRRDAGRSGRCLHGGFRGVSGGGRRGDLPCGRGKRRVRRQRRPHQRGGNRRDDLDAGRGSPAVRGGGRGGVRGRLHRRGHLRPSGARLRADRRSGARQVGPARQRGLRDPGAHRQSRRRAGTALLLRRGDFGGCRDSLGRGRGESSRATRPRWSYQPVRSRRGSAGWRWPSIRRTPSSSGTRATTPTASSFALSASGRSDSARASRSSRRSRAASSSSGSRSRRRRRRRSMWS